MRRVRLVMSGLVQGVGFRPFIYNLAVSGGLTGFVQNVGYGVIAELQGSNQAITDFQKQLIDLAPPNAQLDNIKADDCLLVNNERDFSIRNSLATAVNTTVPFDTGICAACLKEFYDPDHRHFMNFFISCTDCGPRFSCVKRLPYDRENTSMNKFPLCGDCRREYSTPDNRRFHAQATTCQQCGPHYNLYSFHNSQPIPFKSDVDLFDFLADQLTRGKIVSLKGVGGYHLICSPYDRPAVQRLNNSKQRAGKPMALVAADIDVVKTICEVNATEQEWFNSNRTPILLLRQHQSLFPHVNDNLAYIGIMRAYTPALHYLLKRTKLDFLVATSANMSGHPTIIDEDSAINQLTALADFNVHHNRDIEIRCDDSVGFCIDNKFVLSRPGRGFAPVTVPLDHSYNILAVGAHEKVSIGLAANSKLVLSQYLGDLNTWEYANAYEQALHHFLTLYDCHPQVIASDYHPDYFSTKKSLDLSEQYNCPRIQVQHHEAHVLSAMLEHKLDQGIGFAFDGTGYGRDGAVWGSEGFIVENNICRAFHIQYFPLIGGEKAVKEPVRLLYYFLKEIGSPLAENFADPRLEAIYKTASAQIFPLTSSMGRLFDCVAVLLGCGNNNDYEARLPMQLESLIDCSEPGYYSWELSKVNDICTVSPYDLINLIAADVLSGLTRNIIAAKFHNTIARTISAAAQQIYSSCGIRQIILSGGVFQNRYLLTKSIGYLQAAGFSVYYNNRIPINDGGIAAGQINYLLKYYKGE